MLDQALSLFGWPERVHKTLASHRPGSQVDDYFHFHLAYPGGLNVFVTGSLLTAAPVPAYVLHGTRGSLHKQRADVQESQLDQGLLPTAAPFGQEPAGAEGQLTLMHEAEATTSAVAAPRGNYSGLFDAVYQTIREGEPFPVRAEELRWQLEILAGPAA
ncbi:hypothetical protein MUN84_04790 [Hymenobacter sp. 5516J-16]|nr:Gfo/Idh/MocA family oxidoreductase [Hymenobacter sp. 5516J-16]UOQ77956.1 hypothetical protein MUN84_04790 [Hymenobacter sp. 5516J-16]